MFKTIFRYLALTLALSLALGMNNARAEVSLLDTYNTLFHATYESVDDIVTAGLVQAPKRNWTLADMTVLQVLAMDTSNNAIISLQAGKTDTELYTPTPWTGGTRGYGLTGLLDLTDSIYGIGDGHFNILVGKTILSGNNARMFLAPDPADGFLIGFNDNGGWNAGDGDMNEPLLYASLSSSKSSATPIPAAFWLLGTGVVGLIGLRRKNS